MVRKSGLQRAALCLRLWINEPSKQSVAGPVHSNIAYVVNNMY